MESYINGLTDAAKILAQHGQDVSSSTPHSHVTAQGNCPDELRRARRSILSIAARLQTLFAEPTDFLQHLASQNQLLAYLQWLGEFQVLAYIPLSGSVPMIEIAELAGVSENQLCRIVRMTATAGFLHEPQPGRIAHTVLSAPFVNNLCYLDAAMFLAKTAAPTALQMTAATQRHGNSNSPNESAYSLAFNTPQTFQVAYKQRAKLQREWSAYLKCTDDKSDGVTELLKKLDWNGLGNACVVDVGAHSTETATTLSKL